GEGVGEEATDGRRRELLALARAVAGFAQEPRDGLDAPVFLEELEHELPHRRLLLIEDELLVFPAVPEGGRAAGRLPELCPNRHARLRTCRDLLPLPLRHRGDEGVEEAAGGRGGVD